MWWMHLRTEPGNFPPHRTVMEFRFTGPQETIWLLFDRGASSVCVQHPGFESDVVASATAGTFATSSRAFGAGAKPFWRATSRWPGFPS